MIAFSNCKINLGLNILRKRDDGYHDIETVMVPVPWHDVIEILPSQGRDASLTVLGRRVDCEPEQNLVMKAYRQLQTLMGLPAVDIVLQKIVPDGAGLGGGSADASTTLLLLDKMFNLGLPKQQLADIASRLGADCPFFIYDQPMLCSGTGTIMEKVDIDLSGYKILIAKPEGVCISTREAYAAVTPRIPEMPLMQALQQPIKQWQKLVVNDFQAGIIAKAPIIGHVIDTMLEAGAVYAAMTGSGASVFGLFDDDKMTERASLHLQDCTLFTT